MRHAWLLGALALGGWAASPVRFETQEIASDFGVAYAVLVADMNADRRPDVVAISGTQVAWFENPTWRRHVVSEGAAKRDHVAMAIHDIDGDGRPDLALAADWQPTNTASGGTLQWLRNVGEGPWPLFPISEEPTLHRIRFADVDGDGRPELIAAPLHGRGNRAPAWEGQGVRLRVFRIPRQPDRDPWPDEVADDSLHILHNFTLEPAKGRRQALLTASREGVHRIASDGKAWTRSRIGEGNPGEIKLGRLGRQRVLATVEPWHGTSVVVYREGKGLWAREVIERDLTGGHALGWGDLDGDGRDELAVGWRDKKYGVALYRHDNGAWTRQPVDDGMAAEDLAVADLNGDNRPEIVAGGRSTRNVRIYWNRK